MWLIVIVAAAYLLAGAAIWLLLTYRYVALGDSLAAGVGAFAFFGYVPRFALRLMRRRRKLILTRNLGRFGMTSGQLLTAIRTDARFRRAIRGAKLITLNIGGNDLLGCSFQEDCLREAVPVFTRNWEQILREVRLLNPRAVLLTLTLYVPVPRGDIRRPAIAAFIANANSAILGSDLNRRYQVHGTAPLHEAFDGRECIYTWFCRLGDVHPTDEGFAAITAALEAVLPTKSRPYE